MNSNDRKIIIFGKSDSLAELFKKFGFETETFTDADYPQDADTEPKRRNWLNRKIKDSGFKGFLHVVSYDTVLLKDPSTFLSQLETMMKAADYPVWFNTICDPCNYVYSKYNPRISISLDIAQADPGLGKTLCYTSHANTQWICYDMSSVSDDQLTFNESYTVPMFYIIDFLARRRNNKKPGQVFYMNWYLTVDSERGVFCQDMSAKRHEYDNATMAREDAIFKSSGVRYEPDTNIDLILEETAKAFKFVS